jgi:CRP-like cAMP-binding protein
VVGSQHMNSALARKLSAFLPLSPEELKCLAEMQSPPTLVERGEHLVHEGQSGHKAFVVHEGWACSYKDLPNGTRQIISFPLAGDCVGLRSVLLRTADHSFAALTNAVVSAVDAQHLWKCVNDFPRLGAALLWAASRDEAMVVEHLVSVGRRSAIERTAHFFMELAERLHVVGLTKAQSFDCPLSQTVIGDALGLTPIHVNRILRQLRENELLTLRDRIVHIHDLAGLRKLAGFEGGYLDARD